MHPIACEIPLVAADIKCANTHRLAKRISKDPNLAVTDFDAPWDVGFQKLLDILISEGPVGDQLEIIAAKFNAGR